DDAAGLRDGKSRRSGARPRHQVAGSEQERRDAIPGHPRVQGHRRRQRREHHRGHHHDPHAQEPAERSQSGPRPVIHAAHAIDGRPPPDHGEGEQQRDDASARAYRRHRRRRASGPIGRRGDHAAQANSDVERPVLPSYWIPNALIRERFASAIVRSLPAGWNMPENRTGSPVSTPNGTMSSISKSIASPTITPWRSPSSVSSIRARSTPTTSPTSGTRPAMGPPSCPPKTLPSLSACSSLARSSMNMPSRQL